MADDLLANLETGHFWLSDEITVLQLVAAAFHRELERLKNASSPAEGETHDSESTDGQQGRRSPSRKLYHHDYDEIDRTLTGLLALKWLINGDYDSFTNGQHPNNQLTHQSFQQLRTLVDDTLKEPLDHLALITSIIVNDLGKDKDLANDVFGKTGKHCASENHDAILYDAIEADMLPSLLSLDKRRRDAVVAGVKMGTVLNLAQLAQAENVPGNLEPLIELRGHEFSAELKFLEVILDVAGAAGHVFPYGATAFAEPIYQSFMTVHKVIMDILHERCSLREGYDQVLAQRAELLSRNGFRTLKVNQDRDRALLRLITMGRTSTKDQADLFADAFLSLDSATRGDLIKGLNVDGYKDGKAILPYYMPALLQIAIKNTSDQSTSIQSRALASLMRFLRRVLAGTYPDPGKPGQVIEHDLLFAKKTVAGPLFKRKPEVLDHLPLTQNSLPRALTL